MIDWRKVAEDFASFLLTDTSKGHRKRSGDDVRGRCPRSSHEDKSPSFGYNVPGDCWACSCGSGKGSELRAELGWKSLHEEAASLAPRKTVATQPVPAGRDPDDIYEYQNGNRKLKWRFPNGEKTCTWQHKDGDSWKDKASGDPGLYQQEIIKLDVPYIFLSESESDIDSLMSLGFPGVAVPYGANKPPNKQQAEWFNEKTVLIAEHQDENEAGKRFSEKCIDVLTMAGADVFVFRPKQGFKDVREWILAGATTEDIQSVIEKTIPKRPEPITAKQLETMELGEPEWTLEPLGAMETITLVQGNPKGGKSVFCLYCALSIAKGVWISDRFSIDKPRKVLYLAYEDNLRRIQARLVSYNSPMSLGDLPENLLLYERPPTLRLDEPKGRNELKRIVKKYGIEVLMVDTFSYIHGSDENKASEMQPLLATMREIIWSTRINLWLIHHVRKSGQGGDQAEMSTRGRGSTVIAAAPDHILNWGSRVQPNLTYCQFVSKDADEDEFNVQYKKEEDGSVRFLVHDVTEREDVLNREREILTALQTLWVTNSVDLMFNTIQEALPKIPDKTLRVSLKSMSAKNKLRMLKANDVPRKPWIYLPPNDPVK